MRKRRAQTPVRAVAVRPARYYVYTRARVYAYMPLGPPNNYLLYIRFMHLRTLTDYFNEGNFGRMGERERDEAEQDRRTLCLRVLHTLHALETSIGTNAWLRPIIMRSHASQPRIPHRFLYRLYCSRNLSLAHIFARISIDRRRRSRGHFRIYIVFQVGHRQGLLVTHVDRVDCY